jgi:hypothetical protein
MRRTRMLRQLDRRSCEAELPAGHPADLAADPRATASIRLVTREDRWLIVMTVAIGLLIIAVKIF